VTPATQDELVELTEACRRVPLTTKTYLADDYVDALLQTVIDYQQRETTVNNAIAHFKAQRWDEIRNHANLKTCLARYPDDKEGNIELARYLWGYRLWTRAQQLRLLARYLEDREVTTLDQLRGWARTKPWKDFEGKIPGIGFVLYQWLIMRLGVPTVKPDSRILGFIHEVIGRPIGEKEAVDALEEVARRIGVEANVLDWSLWEYRRES
jgi:hypothetical protein